MSKKILLFRQFNVAYDSLNSFNDWLIDEFNREDIKWEIVDITGSWEVMEMNIRNILDDSFDAALAFNSAGQQNITDESGENIFDKYGVPFYSWNLDNPVDLKGCWSSNCKNFYIFCVDRFHLSYVKKNFDFVKDAYFLPHPAFACDEKRSLPLFSDRIYGFTFAGGLTSLEMKWNNIKTFPEEQQILIRSLIDYAISNREKDINIAMDEVLTDLLGTSEIGNENLEFVRCSASTAVSFIRAYYRTLVLNKLMETKIDIHIFGDSCNVISAHETEYIHCHGRVPFGKMAGIFRNSKILLNVMPCFKDGSHDRISSAMLNKTFVISDRSRYLDELPPNMIFLYDIDNLDYMVDIVLELIVNPDKYLDWRERAFEYARDNYSAEKTVKKILSFIDQS